MHFLPLPLYGYRWVIRLFFPFLLILLGLRLWRRKEQISRIGERFGYARIARPKGKLIWIHAISVGESLVALTVIDVIKQQYPHYHFLLTTGTTSSANLIEKRRNIDLIHQYIPLDYPSFMQRFIHHWHPDKVIIMESEIWPHLLLVNLKTYIRKNDTRKIGKVFLVQGRISDKTFRRWQKFPKTIAYLMSIFQLGLAQSQKDCDYLQRLGMKNVHYSGNLKYLNAPLPYSSRDFQQLQNILHNRVFYVATSTHRGEEDYIFATHQKLLQKYPSLLCILIPRHPERGVEIVKLAQKYRFQKTKFQVAIRSQQELPENHHQIYLIDNFGETGLFYALSDLVIMGGSFVPKGGHNLYEAVQHNAICFHGKFMQNFVEMQAEMAAKNIIIPVPDVHNLASEITKLLQDPSALLRKQQAAHAFVQSKSKMIAQFMKHMQNYL